MNLLIDTHILLWWLGYPEKLPDYMLEAIKDTTNTVFVSAAAVWEIVIKKKLGKLDAPDNLHEVLEQNDMTPLSITLDHIFSLEKLPEIHSDPFDRIQIAQAIRDNLVFVTMDKTNKKYKVNLLEE